MNEEEIRPKAIFDEYLRLAAQDTETYFGEAKRISIDCPACGTVGKFTFQKSGFDYEVCPSCRSLYVSPRPVADAFNQYYQSSPSSQYWASTFYKETADARREKLWKPKARQILQIINSHMDAKQPAVVDIGGGYGLFAEEISLLTQTLPLVIEPGPHLADVCRDKGLKVVEKFLEDVGPEDLPATANFFVSFELFEHLHDPGLFLRHLAGLMKSGDMLTFTTLSGTGADIQALWENSKSVSPPHHLNFLNPYSARLIVEASGLEPVEITTPGKLDVDIMSNNQEKIKDRFWRTFVSLATEREKQSCQSWLAENCWSSHMWVTCRKA